MEEDWLKKILDDDDLGLLKVKPKSGAPTADQHLINKFNELNEFVDLHRREPNSSISNVSEFMLHKRLASIRSNADQCTALKDLDKHDLLPVHIVVAEPTAEYITQQKEIKSLEDIFGDDDLGIFSTDNSIFDLKHVPKERAEAEDIAQRKRINDEEFEPYKNIFKAVHTDIRTGNRKLLKFDDRGQSLVAGCYYVLGGVLLFLESIDIHSEAKTIAGKRFRKDGRTRCVFENGTESNMLYRSLAKALYIDGKIVTDTNDLSNERFYQNFNNINEDDKPSGYIYVLESLTTNPDILQIKNLYKIGFSTTEVKTRIANAAKEPTYLMAPVKTVAIYQCFNMNTQKFENLLHTFFGKACLDIQIADEQGKICKPREWFVAPIDVIHDAIELIISGEVIDYKYDIASQRVAER